MVAPCSHLAAGNRKGSREGDLREISDVLVYLFDKYPQTAGFSGFGAYAGCTQGVSRTHVKRTQYAASTCSSSPTVSPVQLFREVRSTPRGVPRFSRSCRPVWAALRPPVRGLRFVVMHPNTKGPFKFALFEVFSVQGDVGFEDEPEACPLVKAQPTQPASPRIGKVLSQEVVKSRFARTPRHE